MERRWNWMTSVNLFSTEIEAVKIMLEKEILLGHDFEDFGYTSAKIVDILRNTKIEYSFIDNGDNGFVKFKDKLMEMLLNDPLIKAQFVKRVRGERVEWNKDGLQEMVEDDAFFSRENDNLNSYCI